VALQLAIQQEMPTLLTEESMPGIYCVCTQNFKESANSEGQAVLPKPTKR
jgi:hypothetical protein